MPYAKTKPPLRAVYRALHREWGPQHWWPARTRFEMIIGAILTQNTAWTNVEKAIDHLRRAGALSPAAIHRMTMTQLAGLIRPSGSYNVKARRVKCFVKWLMEKHGGSLRRLFATDTEVLRRELLAVHGIGPETADCILLYAGSRPVFVVDAYTRRFMVRHDWITARTSYDEIAAPFVRAFARLPADERASVFNEYHALIVELAKKHCRAKPECATCPLRRWLPR